MFCSEPSSPRWRHKKKDRPRWGGPGEVIYLLGRFADLEDCGAAVGAHATRCGLAILHGDRPRVLHLDHPFVLHAVGLHKLTVLIRDSAEAEAADPPILGFGIWAIQPNSTRIQREAC